MANDNDDNPELQLEEFTNLQDQQIWLQNELECKRSQICELKNQIGFVKEREVHYQHVLNTLQSNENLELNKLNDKVKYLEQEHLKLKKDFDLELTKNDEEIERLKKELEDFSLGSPTITNNNRASTDDVNLNSSEIYEEFLTLEKDIQILNDELFEKQSYEEQLQLQNSKLIESVKNSQLELNQLNENINCKKQSFIETTDLINTLEEEMFILKQELDNLKFKCKKQTESENSLFAEVNNKRLKLQDILVDLTQKCNKMKFEVTSKQRQICALRLHNDELTNIVKNDEIEYKTDQKALIETYNTRIATLKNLFEKYKSIILEIEQLESIGLPSNIVQFLNNLIEEKKKFEEKLNEEIGMEFRVQKMMSLQLKEAYLKLQEWKDTTDQLKKKYLEYNETIQKLKERNNESVLESSKHNISKQRRETFIVSINDDENEENIKPENEAASEFVSKLNEKKAVTFAADTKVSSGNHIVRRGGRVIQTKSVYIPSLTKNN